MSDTNCHFVSRFFTKPWERTDRQLWYYDFKKKVIAKRSSKSLYAEYGLNSPEIERRLDSLIETPISQSKEMLEKSTNGETIGVQRWELYRAITLMLPVQTARIYDRLNRKTGLESLLRLNDTEIDQIALAQDKDFIMVFVRTSIQLPLLYPSHGFYPLPCPGKSGKYEIAFAFPIEPNAMIASIPRSCDAAKVLSWWTKKDSKLIPKASVGLNCDMVVIYPDMVEHAEANRANLVEAIEEHRIEMKKTFELCFRFNEKLESIRE